MLLEHDRPARTISKSKEAFIDSIIVRFNLTDATTIATPLAPGTHLSAVDCPTLMDNFGEMANQPYRELVGALVWLALGTRPNIAFAPSSLAGIGHKLGHVDWGRGQTSITLPHGRQAVASHAGRQVPGDRCLQGR